MELRAAICAPQHIDVQYGSAQPGPIGNTQVLFAAMSAIANGGGSSTTCRSVASAFIGRTLLGSPRSELAGRGGCSQSDGARRRGVAQRVGPSIH